MSSLAELRDALTALGLSTSTGSLRGDERRAVLEQRLRDARIKLGLLVEPQREDERRGQHDPEIIVKDCGAYADAYRSMTLSELRSELEARNLSTQTPGLKADARRYALIQRLHNVGVKPFTKIAAIDVPEQAPIEDIEAFKSSRSSTSSYSAASEFLFFDSSRGSDSGRSKPQLLTVPNLRLPTPSINGAPDVSPFSYKTPGLSTLLRFQLERELVDLRKQLHDFRSNRSRATSRRLNEAGFDADLDKLSSAMAQLETERQRLLCIAFAHELVKTTALSGQLMELVQGDAVALIEKRQELLRHQINCIKRALALSRDATEQDNNSEDVQLERAIRRIETQLQQFTASETARSSISSSSVSVPSVRDSDMQSTPVLTRCRSVPTHMFHATWQELDDNQKQQLHHELQAHKSFRIRCDRVCVGNAPLSASDRSGAATVGRQGILAFTRYPPTLADKLGIQALFLEQSQRSHTEIRRVYELALAAEPQHAVVLANYARFLHRRCHDQARAEQLYAQAIQADPLCASSLASYASFLHHTRHEYDRAERLYAQALQVAPDDPWVLGECASLLRKRANGSVSQLLEAKRLLLRALGADKDHIANRRRLLGVLEDLGDTNSLLQRYEQLVRDVAVASGSAGSTDDTSQKLTPRTATAMGQCAHVYGNFANFLQRSTKVDRAKQMYETALRLRPDDCLLQRN